MFDLFEKIEEAIRDLLTTFVSSNLTTMFTDVNDKTGTIAAEVGQTPQAWKAKEDMKDRKTSVMEKLQEKKMESSKMEKTAPKQQNSKEMEIE